MCWIELKSISFIHGSVFLPAAIVTEDPTQTVISVSTLRFVFHFFSQCFCFCFVSLLIPSFVRMFARGQPHHLPGRHALCILRCQLELHVQNAVIRGWPSSKFPHLCGVDTGDKQISVPRLFPGESWQLKF